MLQGWRPRHSKFPVHSPRITQSCSQRRICHATWNANVPMVARCTSIISILLINSGPRTPFNCAERQATAARNAGVRATRKTMTNPISIRGVGQGTQACRHVATLPIAVPNTIHPSKQGASAPFSTGVRRGESTMFNLETPIVEGGGRDLPALLGLRSMSNHNAVLEMAPGREMLTLTGSGEYSINWGPDAIHIYPPRRTGTKWAFGFQN